VRGRGGAWGRGGIQLACNSGCPRLDLSQTSNGNLGVDCQRLQGTIRYEAVHITAVRILLFHMFEVQKVAMHIRFMQLLTS
jgi:hypothetical protein